MIGMDQDLAEMLTKSISDYTKKVGRNISDAEHVQNLFDNGWIQSTLPEMAGGLDFGVDAAALIAKELARSNLSEPVICSYMATRLLALAAPNSIPAIELGETGALSTLGWEGNTTISGPTISGQVENLRGLAFSKYILVLTSKDDQPALIYIDKLDESVSIHETEYVDGSKTHTACFDETSFEILSTSNSVIQEFHKVRLEANLVVASELLGHAETMQSLTLEHLRNRKQFGQSLGSFQALQHRAVDLYIQLLVSQAVLRKSMETIISGCDLNLLNKLSCRTRARLNDTATKTVKESIQLFGALGITEECFLSSHIKRVLSTVSWLGTSSQQRSEYMKTY